MSIYTECMDAFRRLMDGADQAREIRTQVNKGDVFTEIDVVNEASKDAWGNKQWSDARKRANQILAAQYSNLSVIRFGPVSFRGTRDYARIASTIVYANPDHAPKRWKTPNGDFPQMHYEDDPLKTVGRRKASNRDDLEKWAEQRIEFRTEEDPSADKERIAELERECERLREHSATVSNGHPPTREEIKGLVEETVLSLLGDLEGRLAEVEEIRSELGKKP